MGAQKSKNCQSRRHLPAHVWVADVMRVAVGCVLENLVALDRGLVGAQEKVNVGSNVARNGVDIVIVGNVCAGAAGSIWCAATGRAVGLAQIQIPAVWLERALRGSAVDVGHITEGQAHGRVFGVLELGDWGAVESVVEGQLERNTADAGLPDGLAVDAASLDSDHVVLAIGRNRPEVDGLGALVEDVSRWDLSRDAASGDERCSCDSEELHDDTVWYI